MPAPIGVDRRYVRPFLQLEEILLADLFFSLALVPVLAARIFTPLFFALLFARFAAAFPGLHPPGALETLGRAPVWATSDAMLWTCFLLTCLELAVQRSSRWRSFAGPFESKGKGLAAAAFCFLAAGSGGVAEGMLIFAGSVAIGWLVFLAAGLRLSCFGLLAALDPEDDLGLARLMSWAEDILVLFFLFLLLLLPAAAATLAAAFILLVLLLRPALAARDGKRRVPCPRCGAPNVPCAPACAGCGEARTDVCRLDRVGFFGKRPAADLARHRFELLGHRRCPHCGERLAGGAVAQVCAACRRPPFATPAEAEAYLAFVASRLPRAFLVLSVCSFFPLIGLMPGILYYRIRVLAALQGYLPEAPGHIGPWPPRIFNFLLACLQPLPLLGTLALPLMCLVKFQLYRLLLRHEIALRLAAGAAS